MDTKNENTTRENNLQKLNWTEEQWKSWNDAIERIKEEARIVQQQSNKNVGWL